MSKPSAYQERLQRETRFQNERVQSFGEGEARDKFYFLAEKASQRYRDSLTNIKGKRVLIVGCSEGGVTPMAREGAIATGIDIADVPIARLNEAIRKEGLAEKASALVMNAEELNFSDDSFDVICCSGVLHHLDIDKALTHWARVLDSGGRVVMIEPMAWNPVVALYRLFTPSMRTRDEHPLTPKDFRTISGYFDRVEVEGYVLTSVFAVIWAYVPDFLSMKERTRRWLEALDGKLMGAIPWLRYFCWTSVISLYEPRK